MNSGVLFIELSKILQVWYVRFSTNIINNNQNRVSLDLKTKFFRPWTKYHSRLRPYEKINVYNALIFSLLANQE